MASPLVVLRKHQHVTGEAKQLSIIRILLCAFLFQVVSASFTPSDLFAREFVALSSPISGAINSTVVDKNGNVYLAVLDSTNPDTSLSVTKLSSNSSEVWRKNIGENSEDGAFLSIDFTVDDSASSLYLLSANRANSQTLLILRRLRTLDGLETWVNPTIISNLSSTVSPKIAVAQEENRTALYVTYLLNRDDNKRSSIVAKVSESSVFGDLDQIWIAEATTSFFVAHGSSIAVSPVDGHVYAVESASWRDPSERPQLFLRRYEIDSNKSIVAGISSDGVGSDVSLRITDTGSIYIAERSGFLHKLSMQEEAGDNLENLSIDWTISERSILDFDVDKNDSTLIYIGSGFGFVLPPDGEAVEAATSDLIAGVNSSTGSQTFRELFTQSSRNILHDVNTIDFLPSEDRLVLMGGFSRRADVNESSTQEIRASLSAFQYNFSRANRSTETEGPITSPTIENPNLGKTPKSDDLNITVGIAVGCVVIALVAAASFFFIKHSRKKRGAGEGNVADADSPRSLLSPTGRNVLL